MSYCRFSEGDVYVFVSSTGIECCGCILQDREWVDDPDYSFLKGYLKPVGEIVPHSFKTTAEMVDHLQRHIDAGQYVPDDVIPALWADAEENETFLSTGEWPQRV